MRWLRAIAREVWGLLVDDGSLALAILAWVAIALVVARCVAIGARWLGPTLFIGLAGVLIESALRFVRRR